jgi:hypothetical protein
MALHIGGAVPWFVDTGLNSHARAGDPAARRDVHDITLRAGLAGV